MSLYTAPAVAPGTCGPRPRRPPVCAPGASTGIGAPARTGDPSSRCAVGSAAPVALDARRAATISATRTGSGAATGPARPSGIRGLASEDPEPVSLWGASGPAAGHITPAGTRSVGVGQPRHRAGDANSQTASRRAAGSGVNCTWRNQPAGPMRLPPAGPPTAAATAEPSQRSRDAAMACAVAVPLAAAPERAEQPCLTSPGAWIDT